MPKQWVNVSQHLDYAGPHPLDGRSVESAYPEAMRKLRHRRNAKWMVLFGGLALALGIGGTICQWIHSLVPVATIAIVWLIANAIVVARYKLWRCPRCGEVFRGIMFWDGQASARRCVWCGLPLTDADAEHQFSGSA